MATGIQEAENRIEQAWRNKETTLDLSSLELTTLPDRLFDLTNLTELYVQNNQLTTLPDRIGDLTNLTELYVHNNQLTTLPDCIGELKNLTGLNVSYNLLTTLPDTLLHLKKLGHINTRENPLEEGYTIAYEDGGIRGLFDYIRRLQQEATPLYEVKLVLIGEGNVGKTTLLRALRDEEPIKNHPTTEGMEVSQKPILLPHPTKPKVTLQCNAWDFGGQKIYRVQHQFFFSKNTVYLLVWDVRSGVAKCDVEGWLERIQLRVKNQAKVLIVSTHASDTSHASDLTESDLRAKFPQLIFGFYRVDGMEYKNAPEMAELLNTLKQEIARAAVQFPLRRLPSPWAEVRNEVKAKRVQEASLPFREFVEVCQQHGLIEWETRNLARIMNDVGDVVYFENPVLDTDAFEDADSESCDNVVVLQPEWLAKAIGFVVEDKTAIEFQNGEIPHREFHRIWYKARGEKERYAPKHHPFLLWLMEEFFISYRLNRNTSLVPQLITGQRPKNRLWEPGGTAPAGELELNLICEMRQDPPPGLVPQMVVACHPYRYKSNRDLDKNWQTGAFFDRGDLGTALMELRDRELRFTVRDGHPAYFIDDFRTTLEKRIGEIWKGLNYSMVVPCPTKNCIGRFPIDSLIQAKNEGDTLWRCTECAKRQPIAPMLEGLDYSSLAELRALLERIEAAQKESYTLALDYYRRILHAIGTDTKLAPCMFSLFPFDTVGKMQKYRLTLWCEHPDEPHPCQENGEYTIERPKEWYAKVSPYLNGISKVLKVVSPLAERAFEVGLGHKTMEESKAYFELVEKSADALPLGDKRGSLNEEAREAYRAEGEALRLLHGLLEEQVPKHGRKWGGLHRAYNRSTGEYMWVCEKHFSLYHPGLPEMGGE